MLAVGAGIFTHVCEVRLNPVDERLLLISICHS